MFDTTLFNAEISSTHITLFEDGKSIEIESAEHCREELRLITEDGVEIDFKDQDIEVDSQGWANVNCAEGIEHRIRFRVVRDSPLNEGDVA